MEKPIDLKSSAHAMLQGHKIQDHILYPATGYVVLAWSHYEEIHGHRPQTAPVVLTNLVLKRATMLNEKRPSVLLSTLLDGSGKFEFQNEAEFVVSGKINLLEKTGNPAASISSTMNLHGTNSISDWLPLHTNDIYKELGLRGYHYSGAFRGIQRIDNQGKWAEVIWNDNWITFLDSLLQASILTKTTRNLSLPVEIEQITIDPTEFYKSIERSDEPRTGKRRSVRVTVDHSGALISCPGVEIKGLITTDVPRSHKCNLAYEKFTFCPLLDRGPHLELMMALWEIVELVLENNDAKKIQVLDIFTKKEQSCAKTFSEIMLLTPLRQVSNTLYGITINIFFKL